MTTDHHAEAEKLLALAKAGADFRDQAAQYVARAAVHATLADRCPDPAAHTAEDTGTSLADQLDTLWSQVRSGQRLLKDAVPHVRALVDVTELGAKGSDGQR